MDYAVMEGKFSFVLSYRLVVLDGKLGWMAFEIWRDLR